MDEFFVGMTAIFGMVLVFCLGWYFGSTKTNNTYLNAYNENLKSVGIEKIVHCNNVHSNWSEIVWIKK